MPSFIIKTHQPKTSYKGNQIFILNKGMNSGKPQKEPFTNSFVINFANPEDADATLIKNLQWAAAEAAKAGRDVLIEPINTRSVPGFHLNRQDHAHRIVQAVGASNVKVQMDLFHCQIVEGDLSAKVAQYLPTGQVGHFQIAEVPNRHEPGTGEVNWTHIFQTIDKVSAECGWDGWIGCEYKPAATTEAGLGWAASYLKS